jgi:NitT/TauT family transport system substrate-binding protein
MSIAENSLGTSSQLFTEKILALGGLTKADVTFPTIPFPSMSTAFANKGIDAAFAVEPFVNGMVAQHLAKSVMTGAEGFPGGINTVIVISPVFAKQQPEAAKRVMYAFLKGQREYLAAFVDGTNPGDKDAIIQILAKHTAIKDPKLYAGMGLTSGDPNGGFDLNVLNIFQDYFLKNGTQQKLIDTAQVVDLSYADYAVQQLGRA